MLVIWGRRRRLDLVCLTGIGPRGVHVDDLAVFGAVRVIPMRSKPASTWAAADTNMSATATSRVLVWEPNTPQQYHFSTVRAKSKTRFSFTWNSANLRIAGARLAYSCFVTTIEWLSDLLANLENTTRPEGARCQILPKSCPECRVIRERSGDARIVILT